jgi:hypothetical protein
MARVTTRVAAQTQITRELAKRLFKRQDIHISLFE